MTTVTVADETRSREALIENGQRLAAAFRVAGVGAGDAVALLLGNGFAAIEANLAVRRLDAYGVPINWHWHAEEIAYVLADCSPKLLIGDRGLLERVAAILPEGLAV